MNHSFLSKKPSRSELIERQREVMIYKTKKWEVFRQQRAKTIDQYLVVRKR
jgi:hypothetical protein